jgi:hypothetical protein
VRFVLLALLLALLPAQAQEKELEAERRALEAERRVLEQERRALEAERRMESDRRAATGGSAPASVDPCIAADLQRQRACAEAPGNPLTRPPQCTEAMSRVRQYCGR